jgi:hypothetical protein
MTVRELIVALSALPEEDKDREVGCTYDCDCAWTPVFGIAERAESKKGVRRNNERKYLLLQGD